LGHGLDVFGAFEGLDSDLLVKGNPGLGGPMIAVTPIALFASTLVALAQPNSPATDSAGTPRKEAAMSLQLISAAFLPHGVIPKRHTCDGDDKSPSLAWSGTPEGTKSFALIVDDPDAPDPAAPKVTWVHWVLYDIPANVTVLREGVVSKHLPAGTREGINDWKQSGWRGPCPPIGRHRYFFKLYALDTVLPDLHKPAKAVLEKAMEGHVLAHAELVGTYQRLR
jgi:Raf kinase inhibitor-like YbhB/YbcL family protein